MALFKPASPASTEVNSTTAGTPVVPVDVQHVSSGRETLLQSQPEIDLIHHQMDQPQSFGDFAHGTYTGNNRPENQVNLPFSYYRSKGTSLPHQLETRSHTTCERFVHSQTGRSTTCAFPSTTPSTTTTTSLQPEGPTTSLQSLFVQTTMEPLPHGLWSCSSKPLTGRTGLQTEGRFSLSELLEIHPSQDTPTTGQGLVARRHAL